MACANGLGIFAGRAALQNTRNRPSRSQIALGLAVALLAVTTFTSVPRAQANHRGGDDGPIVTTIPLVVDSEPTEARVQEPDVPSDCWTIQEFPYTRDAALNRVEECVDPWVSVHKTFTFQVEAGGTYILWYELLNPGMPAQYSPPSTEVFVESRGELMWLSFQAPLVDVLYGVYGGGHGRGSVEDLGVLARWGWDDDVHIDYRSPEDEIRNGQRTAYAFTAAEDGLWRFTANGHNPLPPGTYDAGNNLRVWVQRLAGAPTDDLEVDEWFDYPPAGELAVERGATVYREFLVRERATGELATNVSVTLSPEGSCSALDPGRLQCVIETSDLTIDSNIFKFVSATHGDHSESTKDWPEFGFTVVERDIVTKAQMTLDASAKGQFVASLYFAGETGLSIEFHENGALTLEASEAVALGVGTDVGVGGGIKAGWVSPRAKAEIGAEVEVKGFETVAIDISDPDDPDQRRAVGAFVADKVLALDGMLASESISYLIELLREDAVRPHFQRYISTDEIGVAGTAKLSGVIGAFTANRPGLGIFNYGLGAGASGSISGSWAYNRKTDEHAVVLRFSASGSSVFGPTIFPTYFEGERIDFSATGSLAVEVNFGFKGFPSANTLETVTFTTSGGTTWREQVSSGSVSITFDADDLAQAGSEIIDPLAIMLHPASTVPFTVADMEAILEYALSDVEGKLVVKQTRGTGFRPAVALGAKLLAGLGIGGEVEVGGEWLLTVTEQIEDWRLLEDNDGERALVRLSSFSFEETEASESSISTIVGDIIGEAVTDSLAGTTVGDWVLEQWESIREVVVGAPSDRSETAEVRIDSQPRTVLDALDREVTALEIGVRIWFSLVLPDWVVPGGSLRGPPAQAGATSEFFASEFLDVGPFGVTVDPPVQVRLSYLSDIADPQALILYRHIGDGVWEPLPTEIDASVRVATAPVSEFGTFVVGLDDMPPAIVPVQTQAGFTAYVADAGSGIDAASLELRVEGATIDATYDQFTGLVSPTQPVADGATISIVVSDTSGNKATHESEVSELPVDDNLQAAASTGDGSPQVTATPLVLSSSGNSSGDDEPGGGGSSLPIIIVIVLLVVAGGGGGAAYYAMRRRRSVGPA